MYIFACLRLFLRRTLEYVCSFQAKRGLSAPPTFSLSPLSLRVGWFSVDYTYSTYQSPLLCSPCLKHQTKKAAVLLPSPLCPQPQSAIVLTLHSSLFSSFLPVSNVRLKGAHRTSLPLSLPSALSWCSVGFVTPLSSFVPVSSVRLCWGVTPLSSFVPVSSVRLCWFCYLSLLFCPCLQRQAKTKAKDMRYWY